MTKPIAPPTPQPPQRDQAHVAAKQLEAFFLRRLLAEARPQGGGGLDGGFAGDTFKQMLDEAVADKMSAAGGIGMADMFAKQLGSAPGVNGAMAPGPNGPLEMGPDIDGMPHLAMPLQGSTLTSGFGYRPDPVLHVMTHPGLDLSAPMGTQVTAASPGTVIHAGPGGNYGNLVMIRHDNGFETRYAHLSAVTVQKGDRVVAGQEVGKVGSTGYSVGPHLHFEVRHDDKAIDPAPLLPLNRSSSRTNR